MPDTLDIVSEKPPGPDCEDCGLPVCMCQFYWKDGAVHGALRRKDLSEDERVRLILAAPAQNWGNPVKAARKEDGVWVFTLALGGLVTRSDLQKSFPGCRVEWDGYKGSVRYIIAKD